MRVLLTGGTGFVGRAVLTALLEHGDQVVQLVRPGRSAGNTETWLNQAGHIQLAIGDVLDPSSLEAAAKDCEAVIHLVGIIREQAQKGMTFERLHVEATRNVIAAAQKQGVRHMIHMSALGARPGATSAYHRSKYEAEQLVIQSGLTYTIFRPSVIFGPDDEFVNMLADLVRLPLTPVIGSGEYLLQPVARQTVAEIFVQSLRNTEAHNRIFEAGGPEQLTYNQILDAIGQALGKPHVRKWHMPLGVMKPMIKMMEGLPFFPITTTQLTMLLEGNVCEDSEALYRVFNTPAIPFQEGIATYLR